MRAKLVDNLFRMPMLLVEMCTFIPHVHCLAHEPLGTEETNCLLISNEARNGPISYVHYLYGHPNATKTRHLCKCHNLYNLAKAKRNSFSGSVARPKVLGKFWYADIKGPIEKPSLVHQNIYVFGIIEAKTRYLIQFYIKRKPDVGTCLKWWYEDKIKALRLTSKWDELTFF